MAGFPESEDPFSEDQLFAAPDPLLVAQTERFAASVYAVYQAYRRAGFNRKQAFALTLRAIDS